MRVRAWKNGEFCVGGVCTGACDRHREQQVQCHQVSTLLSARAASGHFWELTGVGVSGNTAEACVFEISEPKGVFPLPRRKFFCEPEFVLQTTDMEVLSRVVGFFFFFLGIRKRESFFFLGWGWLRHDRLRGLFGRVAP